jgi:hypothetical protein
MRCAFNLPPLVRFPGAANTAPVFLPPWMEKAPRDPHVKLMPNGVIRES